MKVHEYNEMMAYLLRPASLEEKLKEIDEKYPGSVKPANELPPVQDPFKDFEDRNPRETAAQGGVIGKPGGLVEPGVMYYGKTVDRKAKWKTTANVAPEKQTFINKILKEFIDSGKTSFEQFSEITDLVKDKMSRTTAMSAIEQSPYASKISFTGAGSGLDTEILKSDWFKKNYPDAKTIKEASGDQPIAKVRNQYKLAKERGFPISQKQLADEIGIPKGTLRDYISYSRTSLKPKNPDDISRVKRAKEFVNLLKDSGITFTGGGQRYGASDMRFTANPKQIDNFKKTYQENFMTKFTKEQKQLLDNTVKLTYDDMVKSGNVMDKVNFAKLLNTKVGFGSYNAMIRAMDRVLSKKEINAFPKSEFVSGGERGIKKRKSIQMAGEDANKIRKSQDKFLNAMRSEFKNFSDKNLLKLIKNNPQLLNQVTLRFDKKTGEFFNENIDDLDAKTIRMRSQPNVEHIQKIKEAGQQAEWPYNRQVAVRNINGHIKESVEGFINDKEPLLKRKDIPLETKEKIKNQILNIEKKMNDMSLRMYANNKYRGIPEGLPAIDRNTGQLTSFFENVKSMGLDPKTFSAKIPSKFKPFAVAAGLTGGMITAAAANTESPQEASNLLEKTGIGAGVAGGAYAARKPILKTLGKIARPVGRVLGAPSLAGGLALSELTSEDPNLGVAGADLLLPELTKQAGVRGVLANPFQLAEKASRFGNIGRGIASLARAPAMFTPVGLALMGAEGVRMGMREQDRINEMRMNEPEKYQEYLDELESYEDFSA